MVTANIGTIRRSRPAPAPDVSRTSSTSGACGAALGKPQLPQLICAAVAAQGDVFALGTPNLIKLPPLAPPVAPSRPPVRRARCMKLRARLDAPRLRTGREPLRCRYVLHWHPRGTSMTNKAALTAMAALVLLAGCGGESGNTAEGANAAAAGSAANSAAPGAGDPVTREALIGTWGQANCTNTMSFAADGTTTSSSAQQANNRWSLDGSTIVITSPGEEDVRMPATIVNGALHLNGGGGEGASTSLTRCEDAGAADNGTGEGENEAAEEAAE